MTDFTLSPEEEFQFVVAKLTTDELIDLSVRVLQGDIYGNAYIHDGCGCFYGSIAIIQKRERVYGEPYAGEVVRNELLSSRLSTSLGEWGYTRLEEEVMDINRGDTPATNQISAWLHRLLVAEIARRQS